MGTARRRLVAALWCMVVAVAGCGGGGGDDGAGGAASGSGQLVPPADYFPVAAGNRWFWRSATTGQSVASVRAQQSVAGQSAWQTEAVDEDGPATRYIAVGPDSIRAVPNPLDPVESLIGAYDLLRFPMRVGGRFSQLDRSFALDVDGDGRNDSVTIRSEVTVVGLETLSTPLGTLSNVLHTSSRTVTTVSLAAGQGRGEGIVVQDDWYAPDVGPVRTDTSTSILGGPPRLIRACSSPTTSMGAAASRLRQPSVRCIRRTRAGAHRLRRCVSPLTRRWIPSRCAPRDCTSCARTARRFLVDSSGQRKP